MSLMDDAAALLGAMGAADAAADPLLAYIVSSVTERVQNETNRAGVPSGLRRAAAELAAGEYLALKKNAGQLDMEGLDLEAAVKQIQEGDTNTVFAVGDGSMTPEQRLDLLIDRLRRDRSREFLRYRRLVW